MPVQAIDRREAVLVGAVVAHEHRRAAAEWLLRHEFQHGDSLVSAAWLELDHPLPPLDRIRGAARAEQRTHQPMSVAAQPRRAPIVKREGQALVLEDEP